MCDSHRFLEKKINIKLRTQLPMHSQTISNQYNFSRKIFIYNIYTTSFHLSRIHKLKKRTKTIHKACCALCKLNVLACVCPMKLK